MVTALFWLGILMMATAGGLLMFTDVAQQVSGMVLIASLIGIGFVLSAATKILLLMKRTS
ncbi:hypothetical protein [Ferrimonas balearica]|uniref:hypothetical protein n=1 Tax=Ferrimonas balearica TaxID=44012 RepID=UPI001C960D63|nr:hypothetical protein [Ferrimonas balearica]MBY6223092.1 hypothetical protein [Ferrimonas balearica]